jgi:phage-related protein
MPLPLSSTVFAEKNKLATDGVFMPAMSIQIPGTATPFRIVRNNANVTWQGETWVAFPFEIEPIDEDSKGEVPQFQVRIGNVSRVAEAYLQSYDLYCKTSGFTPIVATIYALNSKDLASGVPIAEHEFELQKASTDAMWATFILGASNPFNRRYPKDRILRDRCRFGEPMNTLYGFKGPLCKYAGAETECNRTLLACRTLDNSINFGGFPGAGSGGLRVSV